MPKCTWRDKPGSAEVCAVIADPGEALCPRHKLLDAVRQQAAHEKERKALLNRKHHGPKPLNRRQMIEQGYQFVGNDTCACGKAIEWWRTPNQKDAPYDPMPTINSASNSHFVFCRRGFERRFRRTA